MLVTGEIYHLFNKGIEGRIIFQNKRDYERFLLTLFECNDINPSPDNRHRRHKDRNVSKDKKRPLVEILCFCLMPNHFHMAAKQLADGGIAKFMQRIGNSYTKYFNIKNNRKGSLFMSRYKNVHVSTDSQIRHLITYIHANPLDLIMPSWRAGKTKDFRKVKEFLKDYSWSSYPFYALNKNFDLIPDIIESKTTKMFYSNKEEYFDAIQLWSSRYFEGLDLE